MKNVYIIQNSKYSFDMDISKLYSPNKYLLFIIVNQYGFDKIKARGQEEYFEKIWVIDNFSFNDLKEIIAHNQITYPGMLKIVTNSEESVAACGELRTFFNVDSMNYDRFVNKILMKKLLDMKGISTPKHVLFDSEAYKKNSASYLADLVQTLSFPLIAKPINMYSSIGLQKITSIEELAQWCDTAILNDIAYEIDEFIQGKVYNCDSYIKNNKLIFTQVSKCSNSCYDFICGLTKGSIALPHNTPNYNLLSKYTSDVHDAMGIPEGGVTHLEVIMTENNELYFIEIAHRSPGILIPSMYKKFLDIDTIESHILLQINEDYRLSINQGPFCAWIAFPAKKGVLIKKNAFKIQSEYQLEWVNELGDNLQDAHCGRDYVGRLLLWNHNYQQLQKDFEFLNSFSFYEVSS